MHGREVLGLILGASKLFMSEPANLKLLESRYQRKNLEKKHKSFSKTFPKKFQ